MIHYRPEQNIRFELLRGQLFTWIPDQKKLQTSKAFIERYYFDNSIPPSDFWKYERPYHDITDNYNKIVFRSHSFAILSPLTSSIICVELHSSRGGGGDPFANIYVPYVWQNSKIYAYEDWRR